MIDSCFLGMIGSGKNKLDTFSGNSSQATWNLVFFVSGSMSRERYFAHCSVRLLVSLSQSFWV